MRASFAILAACVVAGCSSTPVNGVRYYPESSLLGSGALRISPSFSIPLEKIVYWGAYAGLAYLITDPLAPNWQIEEAPLGDHRVHFSLQMRRYYAGGAGEARSIFHRRVRELMQYNGYDGYQVIEYSEGMTSSVLGSLRTAEGVVLMTRREEPPSASPKG